MTTCHMIFPVLAHNLPAHSLDSFLECRLGLRTRIALQLDPSKPFLHLKRINGSFHFLFFPYDLIELNPVQEESSYIDVYPK